MSFFILHIASAYKGMTSVVQNLPIGGNRHHLPGNHLAAVLQGSYHGVFDAAAAGHLNAYHSNGPAIVFLYDSCQFLAVIHTIQFGATNQGHLILHELRNELRMEISIGVSGAIG